MSVAITSAPMGPSSRLVQLTQTFTAVMSLPSRETYVSGESKRTNHGDVGGQTVDLSTVLGDVRMSRTCPVADLSRLYVLGGAPLGIVASQGGGGSGMSAPGREHYELIFGGHAAEGRDLGMVSKTASLSAYDALVLDPTDLGRAPMPSPPSSGAAISAGALPRCGLPHQNTATATSVDKNGLKDVGISARAAANVGSSGTNKEAEDPEAGFMAGGSGGLDLGGRDAPCPSWAVQRYLTGSGTHLGHLVLELSRGAVQGSRAGSRVDTGGDETVCVFQVGKLP